MAYATNLSTTDNNGKIMLDPEQVHDILVRPFLAQSVTSQVTTPVTIDGHTNKVRFPILVSDPQVGWTAEGEEIAQGTPEFDQITVTPTKVAGLVIQSNELVNDSNPNALNQVGQGLVRQITNSVDAAFFGPTLAEPAAPGLEAASTAKVTAAAATTFDWAEEAIGLAAGRGYTINHFVANPADAVTMALVKESTTSSRGLLQADPAQPSVKTIGGVPLLTSPHVKAGTVWALPTMAANLVIRQDANVVADTSAFFTSDRTAIRATMRVGFGIVAPDAIVKITLAGA